MNSKYVDKFPQKHFSAEYISIHYSPSTNTRLSTSGKKIKVKVTLVQALRLCTGRAPNKGSRGIALPFHDHGTRR